MLLQQTRWGFMSRNFWHHAEMLARAASKRVPSCRTIMPDVTFRGVLAHAHVYYRVGKKVVVFPVISREW